MDLTINLTKIRQQLGLDNYPYNHIPNDLLLAIFQPTNKLESILVNNYQLPNTEALEYLGDGVLDLIVSTQLINLKVNTANNLTRYRDTIVKNQSLQCYMNSKNLCQFVKRNSSKACADVFEILVGLIYWWLVKKLNLVDAIDQVQLWLDQVWNLKSIIANLVNNNKLFCQINNINNDGVDNSVIEIPYSNDNIDNINEVSIIQAPRDRNVTSWSQVLEQAYLANIVPDGSYQDLLADNYIRSLIEDASRRILDKRNKKLATDLFNYLIFYKTNNLTIPTANDLATFHQDLKAILAGQIESEDAIPIILRLLKFNNITTLKNVDLTSYSSFNK